MTGFREGLASAQMSMTVQPRSLFVLIATFLSLAGSAGCGGAGGAPLSRAEFIEQGNTICRRAAAEQRATAPPTLKTIPLVNRSAFVKPILVTSIERELRRLRAVGLPSGDGGRAQKILRGIEKGLEDARRDPLDPLVKATDPFAPANRLARDYGLKACAESSHAVILPGTFAQLNGVGK